MTAADIVLNKIALLDERKRPCLIAIDGRCASGKTTLADELRTKIDCNVFHMDDFFLRPFQRTKERLRQPGGNVDYERFLEEVILPLEKAIPFSYSPYDCHTQDFKEPVHAAVRPYAIVEGSYSCHPALWEHYDLHIFLTVDPEEQLCRIRRRNGEDGMKVFQDKWIPFEERYFNACGIESRCEICIGSLPSE